MKTETKLKTLLCFTLTFVLHGLTLFAQENDNHKTIKLYTNFGWANTEETLSFDTTNWTSTIEQNQEIQMGHFSPSVSISLANGNFHEFELSRLLFNHTNSVTNLVIDSTGKTVQTIAGQKTTNVLLGFRYAYDMMLFKKKEGTKIQSYLGFSANPYFSNSKYVPIVSASYPTNQNNIGVTLSIIPRLNYNLNDKWFLDFNIPINIIDVNWTFKSDQNPALIEQLQTTTTGEFSTFPRKFLFRFGVGFRL